MNTSPNCKIVCAWRNRRRASELHRKLLAGGDADAIVYGKLFLANPDLPERFERNAPLNEPDQATFYTPGEKGYTDYPIFDRAASA
jgi:N-ethylmaleimide reductase